MQVVKNTLKNTLFASAVDEKTAIFVKYFLR